jgi:hypothetical protein
MVKFANGNYYFEGKAIADFIINIQILKINLPTLIKTIKTENIIKIRAS